MAFDLARRRIVDPTSCDECQIGAAARCPAIKAIRSNLATRTVEQCGADIDVFREGEAADFVAIIRSGWAYKYAVLPNGRRQILQFFIPGDIIDLDAAILRKTPLLFSTRSLTPVEYCAMPVEHYCAIGAASPAEQRLYFKRLRDHLSLKGRHIVDLGQRRALGRMAQLLVEIHERLSERGLVTEAGFSFPARQEHLADAIGITPVHISRILSSLRDSRVIVMEKDRVCITDLGQLKAIALAN